MSSKIRDIRKQTFYWIDNAFMDHYAATVGTDAVSVYNVLTRRANQQSQAWPGYSDLMQLTGLSKNGVRAALKNLEEHDLVTIRHRRQGNIWKSNLYTLLPITQDDIGVGHRVIEGISQDDIGVYHRVIEGISPCDPEQHTHNNTHLTTPNEQHTSTTSEIAAVDDVPAVAADLLKKFAVNTARLNGQSLAVAAWLLDAMSKPYIKNPAGFAISQVQKRQDPPPLFLEIANLDISLTALPNEILREKYARQNIQGAGKPLAETESLSWDAIELIEKIEELL